MIIVETESLGTKDQGRGKRRRLAAWAKARKAEAKAAVARRRVDWRPFHPERVAEACSPQAGHRLRRVPGGVVRRPMRRRVLAPTFDRPGLQALAETAKAGFEEATGVTLPWNLSTHGPYVGHPRVGKRPDPGAEMIGRVARATGWLKAAGQGAKEGRFKTLVELIRRATSPRGMLSPKTTVDLWELAESTRSPGRADRLAKKIRARANQILGPYGLRVSWSAVGQALMGRDLRIGKAAFRAARTTVQKILERRFGFDPNQKAERDVLVLARGLKAALAVPVTVQYWVGDRLAAGEFSSLREAMAAAGRLVANHTGGVEVIVDPTLSTTVEECRVLPGWGQADLRGIRSGAVPVCVVFGPSGRTYHANRIPDQSVCAARDALTAWRREDERTSAPRA